MLETLRTQVWQANLDLVSAGLVIHTWGNVSGVDRSRGCVVIKPSGIVYAQMRPEHMVVVSLDTGQVLGGQFKPSSDTPTHLALYRALPQIGGIVHSHSLYATAWAQAGIDIPALGTTHADYYHGPIPCTRPMRAEEVQADYEAHTGQVIIERMRGQDPMSCPGVLVASHGPFTWGLTPAEAVHQGVVLEHLARLASETVHLNPVVKPIPQVLLDKHFLRKHGPGAYYGQNKGNQG